MDVEVSLADTAPLADAEKRVKSSKSIRGVKSVLSHESNKSSGEQAVDRPPLEVEVAVISIPEAEEAEATVSPIEDTEAEEVQIAAPSGGTLRSKDTAGLPSYMTLSQRLALSMARHPRRNLSLSLLLTLLASAIGVLLSPFKIETSNLLTMYMTRGTEMSNRVKQSQLLGEMSEKRFSDQPQKTNQVKQSETLLTADDPFEELVCSGDWYGSRYMVASDSKDFNLVAMWGIDEDETKHEALDKETSMNANASLLDADSLFEMCREEQHVLQVLEDEQLCYKCTNGFGGDACIQPFSLVGLARAYIKFSETTTESTLWKEFYELLFPSQRLNRWEDIKSSPEVYLSPTMTCQGLREAWKPTVQSSFSSMMRECALELLGKPSTCLLAPEIVAPLVDQAFANNGELRYSTSIYATKKDSDSIQLMYELELSNMLSLARNLDEHNAIQSSYEVGIDPMYTTDDGGFARRRIYKAVDLEYILFSVALAACFLCILVHTRSALITFFGMLQIVLAIPIAWIIYYHALGLSSFPPTSVNAIFIACALGTDDIFVQRNKWRSARQQHPNASTEFIAIHSLPDAYLATLVTSVSTSAAFFATTLTPVPGVVLFGFFAGILVVADYILSVFIVSPVLCLQDEREQSRGCNNDGESWSSSGRTTIDGGITDDETEANAPRESSMNATCSSLKKIVTLDSYFNFLCRHRWPLLALFLGILTACGYTATLLQAPPTDPRPAFLSGSATRFERQRRLLSNLVFYRILMEKQESSQFQIVFGLNPIDNGKFLDPSYEAQGTISFDESFDPASTQLYLLELCDRLFGKDGLGRKLNDDHRHACMMEQFDMWLQDQSTSETPSESFEGECLSSPSVPVPADIFDQCFFAFVNAAGSIGVDRRYLFHEGKLKVLAIHFLANMTILSPSKDVSAEYARIADWSLNEMAQAPRPGASNFFISSKVFWFHETLSKMKSSILVSAGMALATASIVILLATKSMTIMLLSIIVTCYILLATISSVVLMGWTMGLFESVFFSLVVGLGSDFVLHLALAYVSAQVVGGCKEDRAKHALCHMGPSIFASSSTTLVTAFVMTCSEILTTKKFATVLILTMIHSTVGGCFFFLVLCLCFGPQYQYQVAPLPASRTDTTTTFNVNTTKPKILLRDSESSLKVDPETPSNGTKYVKFGLAVVAFMALALVGFETWKGGNAQQSNSVSAFVGGTFEKVGNGFCEGQPSSSPSFLPQLLDGLIFKFINDEPTQELCQTTCSGVGGPGFRGYNYVIENEDIDCVCYFDDGLVPDCPRNDVGSHGWSSSKPASPASFLCAKSELGFAFGPISDDVYALTFGTKAECYRAVNSYVGKSGKTKGSGNNRKSGKGRGKSGKGYYKSGLSFVDEGFCRDSDNQNYDAVWFILAGLLESSHDGKEPGLGLCEAKCKSPPSYNPDIEHFAAHGLVGVNYNTLFSTSMDGTVVNDGKNMSHLSESVSESISSIFAEELGEGFVLSEDITQEVKEQIDLFVNATKTEGGRRLTFGGLDLFVSACFCDYTDDAISCNADDDNGVFTISGGGVSSSPFTTVDLNLSGRGPVPYYASVSAACFDDFDGQGSVSGTSKKPDLGFDCCRNNRFTGSV